MSPGHNRTKGFLFWGGGDREVEGREEVGGGNGTSLTIRWQGMESK